MKVIGSSPIGVAILNFYLQPCPRGLRGESSKLVFVGSNPTGCAIFMQGYHLWWVSRSVKPEKLGSIPNPCANFAHMVECRHSRLKICRSERWSWGFKSLYGHQFLFYISSWWNGYHAVLLSRSSTFKSWWASQFCPYGGNVDTAGLEPADLKYGHGGSNPSTGTTY